MQAPEQGSLLPHPAARTAPAAYAAATEPVLLVAYGVPKPQGSKSFKGWQKTRAGKTIPRMVDDCAQLHDWRSAVAWAARELRTRVGQFSGPLILTMVFTMPAPKNRPKNKPSWPATRPDLDKLARSTGDALSAKSGAGLISDDGCIVGYERLWKCYPTQGRPWDDPDALAEPGVTIRICRLA